MPAPQNSNANPGSTSRGEPENAFDRAQIDDAQRAKGMMPDDPVGDLPNDPNEPPVTAQPAPAPQESDPAPKVEDDDQPVDPRADIYNRFRRQRDVQKHDTPTMDELPPGLRARDPAPAPVTQQAQDTDPPPTPAPAADDAHPEHLTLKIFGDLVPVTYAQAAEMAGLTLEEAEGVKVDALIKFAQIAEANRIRDRRAQTQPAAQPQAPAAADASRDEPATPADDIDLDAIIVNGNDPEGKQAFRKAVRSEATKLMEERKKTSRLEAAQLSAQRAIEDFAQRAPDLANDRDLDRPIVGAAADFMGEQLIKLGADRARVNGLRAIPAQMTELYLLAIAEGHRLPDPAEVMKAAEQDVRTRFAPVIEAKKAQAARAQPAPTPQPAPAPASAAITARVQAKQALPQVSSRSGAEARQTAPDPQLSSRSSAVAKMRAARGQMPLG